MSPSMTPNSPDEESGKRLDVRALRAALVSREADDMDVAETPILDEFRVRLLRRIATDLQRESRNPSGRALKDPQ